MKKEISLPFGLRFMESSTVSDVTTSTYDEDEHLSVFINENGQKIPSVEYYKNLSTKTFTKTQDEDTENDEEYSRGIGTRTYTEVKEESTDSDQDGFSLILSTKTATFVQSENSDEDPDTSYYTNTQSSIAVKTQTRVATEETDSEN